jgi:hypothetical protein
MARLLILLTTAALAGCAAPAVLVEFEHISHPLSGWPVERQSGVGEDDVTQIGAALRYRKAGWYADLGIGANLEGKNGGGFKGPALTGTVRLGYEFQPFAVTP